MQSFDAQTPKKVRDDTIRSCKENLQQQQATAENKLQKQHKETLELEVRKFRRRRVLKMQKLQLDMLRDVRFTFFSLFLYSAASLLRASLFCEPPLFAVPLYPPRSKKKKSLEDYPPGALTHMRGRHLVLKDRDAFLAKIRHFRLEINENDCRFASLRPLLLKIEQNKHEK